MPVLAKFSRPKLFDAAPRERLFHLLDENRGHRAIWICAPPGSGKTTLIASYLEARSLPSLWYQADAGDADAATFFYYLGEAAQTHSRKRAPLPLLTPEYLPDLGGFARRYFREFFDRLSRPATFVLDNYQDAAASPAWRAVTAQALAEIPEQVNVVVISLSEPPAEFAGLRASRQLPVIGWDELCLTLDETRQLAHGKLGDAQARKLHEISGGWVAGLVLMLEHLARAASTLPARALKPAAFDYFAGVVFRNASLDVQRVLLTTALFPRFTVPMAERISGVHDADQLLLDLCERHYFTDRHEHSEAPFQYHALFRDFLLDRLRQTYSIAECHNLEHHAARLLEAYGQREDAVALHCRSGDVESAVRLILEDAPNLLAQGRAQTVASWIDALPEQSVHRQPWLTYWLGTARAFSDPVAGRALLEHSYARFVESNDVLGQLFATCGVVELLYIERSGFEQLDRWIEPLDRLISRAPLDSPDVELRALCVLLTLALYRRPHYPGLPQCVCRIVELLHRDGVNAAQKIKTGTSLLNYYFWQGDPEPGQHLVNLLLPLTACAHPLNQVWAWVAYGYDMLLRAESGGAAQAMQHALSIAEQNGLDFLHGTLSLHAAYPFLGDGDPDAAEPYLNDAALLLDDSRHLEFSLYQFERAWQAALRGDEGDALKYDQRAVDHARKTGLWGPDTICCINLAESLVESGEHERALTCLERARSRTAEIRSPLAEFHILLIQASSALLQNDREQCGKTLRQALAFGREYGFVTTSRWLPRVMARLLAFALEHGIESEYARAIIRRRNLLPESPEVENWPWPVRIYTLGRFAVVRDGEHASLAATAQSRPVALLQALVAAGGREVHSTVLIDQLWPDSEDGHKCFEINLHRLRKLLGSDKACVLHDGKLALDEHYCWVDTRAFERACNAMTENAETATKLAAAEQVLHLYQGQFLASEAEQPWMLKWRERLRSRFLRSVQALGQQWESAGRWADAAVLYQRGLEADDLAEELYRRLMLCHRACGRRAEALEVYRRCRHTLSVVLGIEPASATQALYRNLMDGE